MVSSMLLVGMGTVLSTISNKSEESTITDSKLPKQDINQSILGTDAPTLNIKSNIKICVDKFADCTSLQDQLDVIKENSNCSATDSSGNAISSDSIIVSLNNNDTQTISNYLNKGGIIRVKYYVEDSKGRKTSVVKNVILNLPGGGIASENS